MLWAAGHGATMSGIQTFTPTALEVTDRAVNKVQSLKAEEDNDELKLRVFVTGGGCSGFQYGFSFEDLMAEDDTPVTKDGVTVLIDSLSYQYLAGSTVDYEEGLMGSRFIITNPNASTTCGCGASFSI
jgi:iron-sulfur cluster insertion protein